MLDKVNFRKAIVHCAVFISVFCTVINAFANNIYQSDVCVYGGTSGGVIAAVAAAKLGKSVSLIVVNNHVGGMSSSGLGVTDVGNASTISGLAEEFYLLVGQYYGSSSQVYWFEPHVAEQTFLGMLNSAGVTLYTNEQLASVTQSNQYITQITMVDGTVFQAKEFIDTTYEGDLMAAANVPFTVGREGTNVYGESSAGIQVPTYSYDYDPYVIAGNTNSGLLPFVQLGAPGVPGQGDTSVQCYNFRLCLTQVATNQIPITAPTNYSEAEYELFARYIAAVVAADGSVELDELINIQELIPNNKTDINADGELSTDYIGYNYTYPTNNYAGRQSIYQQHKNYTLGLLYYLANSTNVPLNVRTNMQSWGFAKDEFQDDGGWPYLMYVREARRMMSDYVMTEGNTFNTTVASDPVALGSYTMDSHPVARLAVAGKTQTEGGLGVSVQLPFGISYRSIIPGVGQCKNLFCTFALSASHVGFASIRLEPPFMMLSQAAGTAAAFAIDDAVPVQQVSYPKLAAELIGDGQYVTWGSGQSVSSNGIILYQGNTVGVTYTTGWANGANPGGWGGSYWHDEASGKGTKYVQYVPTLPTNDTYDVYLWWVSASNRSTNTPVDIVYPNGTTRVYVNQQLNGSQWVKIFTTNFNAGTNSSVTIRNVGTASGTYVIANGVRWMPHSAILNGISSAPSVAVVASDAVACEFGTNTGRFSFVSVSGTNSAPVTINYTISGTARNGIDYATIPTNITLAAGMTETNLIITPLGDTLSSNAVTITVTLAASTNYSATNVNTATVTVLDRPLNSWLRTNFTSAQLGNPLISGDSATPAGDGLPNLVKYSLGLSPFTAYTNVLHPVITNGHFSMNYPIATAARDVALTFEYSTNLKTWSSGATYFQQTGIQYQAGTNYITLQTVSPVSSNVTAYVRLQANRL